MSHRAAGGQLKRAVPHLGSTFGIARLEAREEMFPLEAFA
jgi:hypothetical protein